MSAPALDRAAVKREQAVKRLESAKEELEDALELIEGDGLLAETRRSLCHLRTALHHARKRTRKDPVGFLGRTLAEWLDNWRRYWEGESNLRPAQPEAEARFLGDSLELEEAP